MKKIKNKLVTKRGFTLIELIVVITILAILGTIAFLAFKGYSASSRDAKRISDIKSIRTSLELFGLNTGKFPNPNNLHQVTFSGSEIRSQGTFGEQNFRNVEKLSKLPLDPLTELEYTYSVTHSKDEFELGAILETDNTLSLNTIDQSNAVNKKKAIAYIKGNYNGRILKKRIGNKTYVLAIPSIINGDYSLSDIIDLINAKKLVYNGYNNLPASYTGTTFEVNGEDDLDLVNASELVVYSGSIDDLTDPDNSANRIELIKNIKEAYEGTDIENQEGIEEIVNIDFNSPDSEDYQEYIAGTIVNNELGGEIKVTPVVIPGNGGNNGGEGGEGGGVIPCVLTQEEVENLNSFFLTKTTYNGNESYWCGLTEIDVTGKNLEGDLPTEVGKLTNLISLKIGMIEDYSGFNNLTSLPSNIGNLKNLKELDISGNRLIIVPQELWNLINLEKLNIFAIADYYIGTPLDLPSGIGNLTNLINLNIGYNFLETLPSEIINLKKLLELNILENFGYDGPVFNKDSSLFVYKDINIYGNGTNVIIKFEIKNCAAKPNYQNAIFVNGFPITEGISWQNTDSDKACYYSCKDGYSGNDCNTFVCAPKPNDENAIFVDGNPSIPLKNRQNTNSNEACYFSCKDGTSWNGFKCSNDYPANNINIDGTTTVYIPDHAGGKDRFLFVEGFDSVSDNLTQLEWQKDGLISGELSWEDAKLYCENLTIGSKSDWRLPDITELRSIIDYSKGNAQHAYDGTIDTSFFNIYNGSYRSSTTNIEKETEAWGVNFNSGRVSYLGNKIYEDRVRCVRGTSSKLPWQGTILFDPEHNTGTGNNGDTVPGEDRFSFLIGSTAGLTNIVKDNITGLIWQSNGTISGKINRETANNYCNNLSIGEYNNWRIPNVNELSSIIDYTKIQPNIDNNFFTSNNDYYWTSTKYAENNYEAWYITSSKGYTENYYLTNTNSVRCVH